MRTVIAAFLCLISVCAFAQQPFISIGGPSTARSQVNPAPLQVGNEYPLENDLLTFQPWTYEDNSGHPGPLELDGNGYPLYGSSGMVSHGGLYRVGDLPSQAIRPGYYISTWTGGGAVQVYDQYSSNTAIVSGVGSCSGQTCDNSACTTAQGYIVGTTLTITSPSSCNFVQGQPISGGGISVSTFGVPTIITALGSGSGGTGTYTVNFPQTVGSVGNPITINPGGRMVTNAGNEGTAVNSAWAWLLNSTSPGNTVQHTALFHANDEANYWTGNLAAPLYKRRIAQGNFALLRDLDWGGAFGTCTTWATRKPSAYYTYNSPEMRASLLASAITYNGGTDTYSITFGSGNWVDKELVIAEIPTTGDASSTVSLNGNSAIPIVNVGQGTVTPTAGWWAMFYYDATLNKAIITGGVVGTYDTLECGMPPEAFIEINHELGTNPYIVAQPFSIDPMTDWIKSYALYIKSTYPSMKPVFETFDEIWNCAQPYASYFSAKSLVYISQDPAWTQANGWCGPGGNFVDEEGKIASTMGQDLASVYSPGQYEFIAGVQTSGYAPSWVDALTSNDYLNQTIIPVQSGYTKTPAYKYTTRIVVDNYWATANYQQPAEISAAWCYFYKTGGCALPSDIMTGYMLSALVNQNNVTIAQRISTYQTWGPLAKDCGEVSFPTGCAINQSFPMFGYEGGYNEEAPTTDATVSATASNNSSSCVLTTAANGAVAGMPIKITAASGGTWPSIIGNAYTVQATGLDGTHVPINLNCASLGTLSSATLDYVGSQNYLTYFIENSYLSPSLRNLTTGMYYGFAQNGGLFPSQFTLSGTYGPSYPWTVWSFDLYGYFTLANCSACTISGSTLTLGGTVTGIFAAGQTLFGAGVTSPTTITGPCSGGTPCGANSGDTLSLSASSTVSSGTGMSGNIAPTLDPAGTAYDSPITAWPAIRAWNGNSGGYLLKRDLDPASNDNSPVGLGAAA